MKDFRFEAPDEVVHIENPEQKMIVKEVKRRTIMISTGEMDGDKKGFIKKPINRIEAIICYWYEDVEGSSKKKYMERPFHSGMLIPYEVAVRGIDAIGEWQKKKTLHNLNTNKNKS